MLAQAPVQGYLVKICIYLDVQANEVMIQQSYVLFITKSDKEQIYEISYPLQLEGRQAAVVVY